MSSKAVVIAFVSGKGGTGKTTITANFGMELASAQHPGAPEGKDWKNRVLIIDNDYATGGGSYLLAGGERLRSGFESNLIQANSCFFDCYKEKIPADQVAPLMLGFEHDMVGEFEVHVMLNSLAWWTTTSPTSVDEQEQTEIDLDERAENFLDDQLMPYYETLIERFKYEYDYILIDSRGGADTRAAAAAVIADSIVIVTEPGEVAGKQDLSFVRSLRELSTSLGRPMSKVAFIYNRVIDGERARATPKEDLPVIGRLPISQQVVQCYRNTELIFESHPMDPFCVEAVRAFGKVFPGIEGVCHAKRRAAERRITVETWASRVSSYLKYALVGLAFLVALGTAWTLNGSGAQLGPALTWLGYLIPISALLAGGVLGSLGVLEALKRQERSWLIGWASFGGAVMLFALVLGLMAGRGLLTAKNEAPKSSAAEITINAE